MAIESKLTAVPGTIHQRQRLIQAVQHASPHELCQRAIIRDGFSLPASFRFFDLIQVRKETSSIFLSHYQA